MPRDRFSLPSSEITPKALFLRRREFLRLGAAGAVGLGGLLLARGALAAKGAAHGEKLQGFKPGAVNVDPKADKLTPWDDVTTYNNFYEFGTGKSDPASNSGRSSRSPGRSRARASSPRRRRSRSTS
jgi:methionine sulfoxide reductase catalytic subunit